MANNQGRNTVVGHRRLQLPLARLRLVTCLFKAGLLMTGVLLNRLFMTMATSALVLMRTKQFLQHQTGSFNESRTDSSAILQAEG